MDAKLFLLKILEISTVNYNNSATATPQLAYPETIEDWMKLEFPPQFKEQIKTSKDFNFMGKFLFEKAEASFVFIDEIIRVFETTGLHVHALPLLIFQRLFAAEVLASPHLEAL